MVVANWLGNENGISVFAVCADDQVQAAVANGQSSETPVDWQTFSEEGLGLMA